MTYCFVKFVAAGSFFATLGLVTLQVQASLLPQPLLSPALMVDVRESQFLLPALTAEPFDLTLFDQEPEPTLYELVHELQQLPIGKAYREYLRMLEQGGYLIRSYESDQLQGEFLLEKLQHTLRLTVAYHPVTKISTRITVSGPRIADEAPTSQRQHSLLTQLPSPL